MRLDGVDLQSKYKHGISLSTYQSESTQVSNMLQPAGMCAAAAAAQLIGGGHCDGHI